jgi:hypothetical protein
LPLSKRSQVANIKALWQQETLFSDWLITPDGIDLLAQDLEIEIENPRREGKGANFSCDIVANIVGDESHIVVIENELGVTLQWRPMLDKSSSKILLEEKIDPKIEANRKAMCDWFAKWTPKMFLAFSKRVKTLSAPEQI